MFNRVIFYQLEKLTVGTVGPWFRRVGQNLHKTGLKLQGSMAHEDYLVPSLRCIPISKSKFPKLLQADWVAPNATVVGSVDVGENASLWHGTVIRGDNAKITIGKNAIIQDLAHVTSSDPVNHSKVEIGDNAYVGPNCVIDGCILEPYAFVGMGATVHKGSTVEGFAVVAAGAAIPENTVVPTGQVWAGNPAKYIRDLTQEERIALAEYRQEMQQLALIYAEETEKTPKEILNSFDENVRYRFQDPMDKIFQVLAELGYPLEFDDMEFIEQRVYSEYGKSSFDHFMSHPNYEKNGDTRGWTPYEQDLSNYPEVFKIYGENFERFERAKAKFESEPENVQQDEDPRIKKLPKDQSPWERKYDTNMPRTQGTSSQ